MLIFDREIKKDSLTFFVFCWTQLIFVIDFQKVREKLERKRASGVLGPEYKLRIEMT